MAMNDLMCPACQVPLSRAVTPEGALWRCETCSGLAANLAVVRRHLSAEAVREFWLKATTESTPSSRKCPSCAQRLSEFTECVNDRRIRLDLCRSCQLMWFDKNELEAFPRGEKVERPDAQLDYASAAMGLDMQADSGEGRDESFGNLCVQALIVIIRLILLRS
jgi:Zn-finger nucleic acid-binding protein